MFDLLLNLRIFNLLMKLMILGLILVLAVVLLLFCFQDKLIYVPSFGKMVPQHMENNPVGYRSPSERGLQFKDVNVDTSDGETLHGWFIYKNEHSPVFKKSSSPKKKMTSSDQGKFENLRKYFQRIIIRFTEFYLIVQSCLNLEFNNFRRKRNSDERFNRVRI